MLRSPFEVLLTFKITWEFIVNFSHRDNCRQLILIKKIWRQPSQDFRSFSSTCFPTLFSRFTRTWGKQIDDMHGGSESLPGIIENRNKITNSLGSFFFRRLNSLTSFSIIPSQRGKQKNKFPMQMQASRVQNYSLNCPFELFSISRWEGSSKFSVYTSDPITNCTLYADVLNYANGSIFDWSDSCLLL